MGQYIAFEAAVSAAGAKADIRVRATPAEQAAAAWLVAAKIAQAKGLSLPQGATADDNPGLKAAALSDADPSQYTADALLAAGKNGLVYVGGAATNDIKMQPLLQAANFINAALGAEGTTVVSKPVPASATVPNLAAVKKCWRSWMLTTQWSLLA